MEEDAKAKALADQKAAEEAFAKEEKAKALREKHAA